MDTTTLVTFGLVIVYLFIIAFLGYQGYKRTHGASDYLLAGREIHPYVMALSYGATFISTSAIIGFGGAAGVFGMGLLWLTFLNIMVGIFIAFVFFGKRTRRMGYHLHAHTFPEFLARRFQSSFMQKFAGIIIFLFMPLYAAVVLIGAAKFLENLFPALNYETALLLFTLIIAAYVIMGGLKGVMYTDAFQGTIMFVGMAVLLVATYYILGGVVDAHQSLTDLPVPPPLAAKGHMGWTSMPEMGSEFWWILVSTIIMGVGIGVLAQPQLIVRFMTVKSNKELNRAILVGGVFILLMTGVAFVSGALSNVYFTQNPDRIEFCQETKAIREISPTSRQVEVNAENLAQVQTQHANAAVGETVTMSVPCTPTNRGTLSIVAANRQVAQIIPQYIKQAMPAWFSIIFMLTLLAAAMSTLSSQFHTMGTAIGRDVYEQMVSKENVSENRTIWISKIGIGVVILFSAIIALALPKIFTRGEAIIASGTALFFGLCASAFLPAYLGGLYFKRITKAGAVAGMVGGFSVSAFWLFFVHGKEASKIGLCEAIFGTPTLLGKPWAVVDPLFVALPVSIILTIVVSLFTKKFEDDHLNKCFKDL